MLTVSINKLDVGVGQKIGIMEGIEGVYIV